MTPVLHNEGSVWLLGIVWDAEILAAFLAWWMPFNLVSYLAFLAVFTWLDDENASWEPRAFSLTTLLLMTLFFWPGAVVLTPFAMGSAYLEVRRDTRRRRASLKSSEPRFTIDWKTQGAR